MWLFQLFFLSSQSYVGVAVVVIMPFFRFRFVFSPTFRNINLFFSYFVVVRVHAMFFFFCSLFLFIHARRSPCVHAVRFVSFRIAIVLLFSLLFSPFCFLCSLVRSECVIYVTYNKFASFFPCCTCFVCCIFLTSYVCVCVRFLCVYCVVHFHRPSCVLFRRSYDWMRN